MTQPKKRPTGKRAAPAGRAQRPGVSRLERRCEALRAELCSVLSHDLRNPLTGIVWSAQLLARRLPAEDASRRHLDAITRAADEITKMLDELSDAARIPDGQLALRLELTPGDLGTLVEQAVTPSRGLAQSKDLDLSIAVADGIEPMTCDRDRIARVLAGLVGNAVRRTPRHGAVTVRAARFAEGDGEGVRIAVEDSGPDIVEEDRASLFDLPIPLPPGAPRRPRPVSPALAPFVARGVIEAHGGRIWIEGEPGRGTTFVLTLPVG